MSHALSSGAHSITFNGIEQSFRVAGSGPPCIVHSGGPGIESGYLRLPLLESYLTMIYLDPIGTGESGRLPTHPMGYSIERFTDQLLAFIAEAGIENPYLLGHSHGAFVVLNAALKRPDGIAGLVLYAGAAFTGEDFMPAAGAAIDAFIDRHKGTREGESVQRAWASIPNMRSDKDYTAAMRDLLPAYFSDHRCFPEILTRLREHLSATILIGDTQPFDVRDRLAALSLPTLIMVGVDDFILGPRHSSTLATGIPNARLEVFAKSGHFAHIEEPESFADAIIRFTSVEGGEEAGGLPMPESAALRSRFADRVRALLGEKGLTSDELADRSSLPPSRIDRILGGRLVPITLRDITIIAAVLGTPIYSLLVPTAPTVEVVSLEVVEEGGSGDA